MYKAHDWFCGSDKKVFLSNKIKGNGSPLEKLLTLYNKDLY